MDFRQEITVNWAVTHTVYVNSTTKTYRDVLTIAQCTDDGQSAVYPHWRADCTSAQKDELDEDSAFMSCRGTEEIRCCLP
ncbi:hypothetical protein J1614_000680 [Plenodomus biglobosus]|nr:hypothetical protein J1614_000680 [Plenodomus biglobosus]